jgi:hypothetical protein
MGDEEKSTGDAGIGTAAAAEAPVEQPEADEHTTAPDQPQPQAPPAKKWEMPKPVFQQTSGYLPQGFIKDIQAASDLDGAAASDGAAPAAASPGISAPAVAAAAVEPQPDLSEQLIPEEPANEAPAAAPKKAGITAPMVLLGLLAVIAFIAVFLAVIYFLFLKAPGGTNNF